MKDIEKIQADASTVQDCSKTITVYCQDRVKIEINQRLRDMDRRLNRIIRRNSRIMKCDKRNSKLERFEETVDGVMDWIYDAELFVSSAVEGTYEAVRERTHRLEVMLVFLASVLLVCLSFVGVRENRGQALSKMYFGCEGVGVNPCLGYQYVLEKLSA